MLKLILILFILRISNCEISFPEYALNAKDAIEAEGNRKARENLMKNVEFSESSGVVGRNFLKKKIVKALKRYFLYFKVSLLVEIWRNWVNFLFRLQFLCSMVIGISVEVP